MRLMGLLFAVVGSLLFVSGIFLLLDPTSTIGCNGVVTTSPGCKRSFTSLGAVSAVVGVAMLFAKSHWLDAMFAWSESLRFTWPWKRRAE